MRSKKMIIKNCPACYLYGNKYGCEDNHDEQGRDTYCELIDNCIMKQIVELCEQYKKDYNTTNGVWLLANNITNLLGIQEVE